MADTADHPLPAVPADIVIAGQGVFVRGLRLDAEIGLYAHERGRRQPVVIDVELALDPRPTRHLRDTFNYEAVVKAARAIAEGGHVELVETFAHRLAAACLEHGGVRRAVVRVAKPEALPDADGAGAEVTLARL